MNQPAAKSDEVVVIAFDLEVECSPRFGDAFDRDDRLPFAGAVSQQIVRFERLRQGNLSPTTVSSFLGRLFEFLEQPAQFTKCIF